MAREVDFFFDFEANTKLAAERGVFGSPTFIVGGDVFFGNDRLGFLEERILREEG